MAKTCPECGAPIDVECPAPEAPLASPTPQAPKSPKTAKTGSSVARWVMIILVALLVLLIGGLYLYDYQAERHREQRAYELLQDCSNPDFYEDFIIRFPKSSHIDEVRERYKAVAAQQGEWQKIIDGGSREDLEQFVRLHPTSPYVKVAQLRMDSLDWAEAKQRRSLEAINQYMLAHPNGYYLDQAEIMRQIAEYVANDGALSVAELNEIDTDLWRRGVTAFTAPILAEEMQTLSRFLLKTA